MSTLKPKCMWLLDPRRVVGGLSGRVVRRDGALVCSNHARWVISDGDRTVYVCDACMIEARGAFPAWAEVRELPADDDGA